MRVGVDLVDVERFRAVVARSPRFARRFFSAEELHYCEGTPDPVLRLAGTFAAKEAVMKAAGLTPAPSWAARITITRSSDGAPRARVLAKELPISISHDGGHAVAVAIDLEDS